MGSDINILTYSCIQEMFAIVIYFKIKKKVREFPLLSVDHNGSASPIIVILHCQTGSKQQLTCQQSSKNFCFCYILQNS